MDTALIEDIELRKKWFGMTIQDQIGNIGSEVNRAIRWEKKGDLKRAQDFCKKAKELLQITMEDPKNRHRIGELFNAMSELEDRFFGDNIYQTTDEMLRKYYDVFL